MKRKIQLSSRHRGTAEIELLLSVLVLLAILMLVWGGAKIGLARLDTATDVETKALGNAATGSPPQYTEDPDLTEVTTEWDVKPGLPNRTHVARAQATVPLTTGSATDSLPPAKVSAIAGAISPGWAMTGYPVASDEATMQSWFEQYINDSHPELIAPLILSPDWRP
jgi:hypothetical protein